MANLHVQLPNEVLIRIANIATEEFNGNVALYIRTIILLDLVRRDVLSEMEFKLLNEILH